MKYHFRGRLENIEILYLNILHGTCVCTFSSKLVRKSILYLTGFVRRTRNVCRLFLERAAGLQPTHSRYLENALSESNPVSDKRYVENKMKGNRDGQ